MLRTEIFRQYNNNEDLNRKEAEIRVALLMEPENLSYLKELGALVYYKKNCKSAKVIYKKLTELEPEMEIILLSLGIFIMNSKNMKKQ